MATGGGGWSNNLKPAAASPAMESINDADSLHVNPGSPRTPLPPLAVAAVAAVPPLALSNEKPASSGTDETDLKGEDGVVVEERQREKEKDKAKGTKGDDDVAKLTRFTLDPAGELTHDETTVDVVTVPCPGGHPLRSWNRDGLMSRYFGAPSMRDAEVNEAERPGPSWVRQGIRRDADRARILLYEHPEMPEGTTLNKLATALLDDLRKLRMHEGQERPLVFISHSVGGLVVKMALVKASRDLKYESIVRDCYGIAFFGTPHQGSSYFAMPSLASSIQNLLQLSAPMPQSLTHELRMGNSLLLHVDEDFKTIADDLRVWTFYETIDSRLSGSSSGDVYFTAPLASIKSAILGMRQERIFPLQSDHANIASFGRHNVHTLRLFLKQLATQIERADLNCQEEAGGRWALNLEQKVNVEVHGFFDEAASGVADGTVRAWSTRLPLRDFLSKGPEACLSERLNEVDDPPEESRFLAKRGGPLWSRWKGRRSRLMRRQSTADISPTTAVATSIAYYLPCRSEERVCPDDLYETCFWSSDTTHPTNFPPTRYSTPLRKPSPLIRPDLDQELAIDRLSPPLRGRPGRPFSRSMSLGSDAGAVSPPRYRDFPPFSQRSRSTFDGALSGEEEADDDDEDDIEASPRLPESIVPVRKMAKDGKRVPIEAVVMDEVPVAFVKPEVKARKFVWIHLPFNNPTWVTSVLQSLQVSYKRDFSSLSNHDFWMTRHTRGRHSQHYAYFAKPGCYFTAPRTLSPRNHSHISPTLSPTSPDDAIYTCLFLPYLHFDSYKKMLRRRELILQRLAHGRAHPIPESVAKSDSLELQVVWEFLGHDPPINCRRTLDQFGYPSLRDTRSRDDDQMLYKLTKERDCGVDEHRGLHSHDSSSKSGSDGSTTENQSGSGTGSWRERLNRRDENEEDAPQAEVLNGNVLMVDQLWLWAISSHTLLTFFPKRESDPIEGPLYQQADLRDSIFNDVNVDLTRQCDNALDLAALAALHAVSVLLDRSSHPDLEVFRIFEEAISVLTEKLTSSLKEFRSEGFRDKAFDYEPVENKARSIRARHKEEGRRAEQENRDNTSALLELRDIEDELQILLHLFERQSKVISSMHSIYNRPEMRDQTTHGRVFLAEALKRLSEYIHQADEMIRRVRSTRDDYDKLLQMVQRQAQVDEVRLSRLHADLASAQSRSVLIFTTFTVIFLPLQFFTGIFGMNTREWGGGDNLPLKEIGEIALPASVFLIVFTLFVAWSTNVRQAFRWVGRRNGRGMRWAYVILWRPLARRMVNMMAGGKKRRQGGRGEESSGKGGAVREASDFWERHRLERERGYRIPEVNKAAGARRVNRSKVKEGGSDDT
ncbi:Protein SERAC1-like protein [Cladobotryum mycophilum]|uniref:Protein SERAC1-like protein n=1 Tax=Cladobotryum mycophilum TaxID=491253 RepID=A0ABR0SPB9_9HYPO